MERDWGWEAAKHLVMHSTATLSPPSAHLAKNYPAPKANNVEIERPTSEDYISEKWLSSKSLGKIATLNKSMKERKFNV